MCVFTVVMTYSITCPIIVPFGRHRRAGTWALLGGTQDLTLLTVVRQAALSGQGPGWETGPSGLPPGPCLSLGPGLGGRRGKTISAQTSWCAGPLGKVTPTWPHSSTPSAFARLMHSDTPHMSTAGCAHVRAHTHTHTPAQGPPGHLETGHKLRKDLWIPGWG